MSQDIHTIKHQVLTASASKELVDAYVSDVFKKRRIQARSISPHYEQVWKAVEKLFQAGGKRTRPYTMLLSYQAFGGSSFESVLPAAAAQEILHQATLIHDDVIDRDITRYHIKNVTGQFLDIYESIMPDQADRRHFSESMAVLAGDLLLSEAHHLITQSTELPERVAAAHDILTESVFHVIGGELLDTEAPFRSSSEIDPLTVAAQKTASYSFVSPFMMGAALAGASKPQLDTLKDIGNTVGIAYQLRDDILGVFGSEEVTGKSADSDLCEGKRTLLIDEFYKRSSKEQQLRFEHYFGNPNATKAELTAAKELLAETGTKAAIESYIENYKTQTITQLSELHIDGPYIAAIGTLIEKSLTRIA